MLARSDGVVCGCYIITSPFLPPFVSMTNHRDGVFFLERGSLPASHRPELLKNGTGAGGPCHARFALSGRRGLRFCSLYLPDTVAITTDFYGEAIMKGRFLPTSEQSTVH